MKSAKIDAAYVTADTSVVATNIEPSMAPSNSALKNGLVTMLWCYVIVISTCYVIVLLGGAMSAGNMVYLWCFRKKFCRARGQAASKKI